jgi:hypothetical protein
MLSSIGIFRYTPEKLYIEVDPGIADYYRSLIPKYFKVHTTRYAPHISVVREENPNNKWGLYNGAQFVFEYDSYIHNDGGVYWWLNVRSKILSNLRVELGLPRWSKLSRPPDGSDNFHITIGNTK